MLKLTRICDRCGREAQIDHIGDYADMIPVSIKINWNLRDAILNYSMRESTADFCPGCWERLKSALTALEYYFSNASPHFTDVMLPTIPSTEEQAPGLLVSAESQA